MAFLDRVENYFIARVEKKKVLQELLKIVVFDVIVTLDLHLETVGELPTEFRIQDLTGRVQGRCSVLDNLKLFLAKHYSYEADTFYDEIMSMYQNAKNQDDFNRSALVEEICALIEQ